ncbi:MAG: sodium transporter, partial [bacterium]
TAFSISIASAILLIGVITLVYDVLGGIRIVILSDVLQMMIIVVGIVICGAVALYLVGWESAWSTLSPERFQILDFKRWGLSPEGSYAFWPMTIGGIFLYASYYGCDQSQVQRELTVGSVDDVRKSLMVNALGRFPLVLMYCLLGVLVGAIFASPDSLNHIASMMKIDSQSVSQMLENNPDRMMPLFIFSYLPHGVIGFIFVAIMAALMSSLDSGLNSLSAVTMRDFYQKYIKQESDDRQYLIASKSITLFWGIFCIVAALLFAELGEATRHTTIVLINAVGSLLYGPILAAFLLGMFTTRVGARAVKIGVVAGILLNIYLWIFTPFSWLWWNFTGFTGSVAAVLLISTFYGNNEADKFSTVESIQATDDSSKKWKTIYKLTVLYFFLIIFISYLIERTG